MAIGWMDNLDEADTFFKTRLNNSSWTVLGGDERTAALTTAYNRIRYCSDYSIPASPTIAQKAKLKDAQCEMAIYMATHLADEDRRKGLQIQGVTHAGIVEENYDKDWLDKLPIPPIVDSILEDFKTAVDFGLIDIDRDEEESVDTDATDV
ncbi:hypothetical protein AMJ44_14080 [candidate division WOR-1 bacterium DG_54_3]|uniref:Uncharacterized protein n=1 Tax=candidate division WOR-1 bacterium DG_54_3 TaxID=1703775 RepID=A0A0S7XMN0_UNCSA|nr:MAG: hypothetical protein AMJ44_14080 [candidate division WOR-1 bacterium DG_54_3]